MTFDQPGSYILRLTGDDGVLSTTDDVVVTVTNADLTTIRSMYGGGVTRVRVYNDSTSTVISNTVHFGLAGVLGSTGRTVGSDGTDSGIVRYTPYGTVRTGVVADLVVDQTFTGQTNDPGTGLIDYNARQYDPQLAKFIQPDTIVPDMANPQDLNRYMYVRGNPVNLVDPSGHETCDLVTGACWDDFEDSLYGSPWSSTRSNDMDVISDFVIDSELFGGLFDVGRDWAAGEDELTPDGFQSREDFEAVSATSSSPFLSEVADNVLDREEFDTRSWYSGAAGFVAENWTYIATAGVCIATGFAGCAAAATAAWYYRSWETTGSLNPMDYGRDQWVDFGVSGVLLVATGGIGYAAWQGSSGVAVTAVGRSSLQLTGKTAAVKATEVVLNVYAMVPQMVCHAESKEPNGVCS